MYTDPEERHLVARVAKGDKSAMSELYLAYEPGLFAYAMKKLNDPQAAADIVHEVMIAVWNGASGYQGRSKVKTWLFGIAHNKAVDQVRKEVRHRAEDLDQYVPDSDTVNSEELIQAAENREILELCLGKLSEFHRQVVHLAYFEDMPYAEIAEIAGVPEGTVRTRMFHAKQLLKKCLARRLNPA